MDLHTRNPVKKRKATKKPLNFKGFDVQNALVDGTRARDPRRDSPGNKASIYAGYRAFPIPKLTDFLAKTQRKRKFIFQSF